MAMASPEDCGLELPFREEEQAQSWPQASTEMRSSWPPPSIPTLQARVSAVSALTEPADPDSHRVAVRFMEEQEAFSPRPYPALNESFQMPGSEPAPPRSHSAPSSIASSVRSSVRSSMRSSVRSRNRTGSSSSSTASTFLNTFDVKRLARFRFKDLQNSWVLWVLRGYHGLCFLLAIVVIAGVGINSEVNLFFEFFEHTTKTGAGVLNVKSWMRILATLSTALLFMLAYTGLLLRAFWLLADAISVDCFYTYRRTLCCEGSGPGTFPKHLREVTITDAKDLRLVHRALSLDCTLEREIYVAGTCIFSGAQLLHQGSMHDQVGRDDVRDLTLPAKLVFSATSRPISFHGSKINYAGAVWDMTCQWLIFGSLDVFPVLYAFKDYFIAGDDEPLAMVTVARVRKMMIGGVAVACIHACIYYTWSTVMDYVDKAVTFQNLLAELEQQAKAAIDVPRRSMSRRSVAGGRASSYAMPRRSIAAAQAHDLERVLGVCGTDTYSDIGGVDSQGPDEELNACVCLHDLLASSSCHTFLFACIIVSIVAAIASAGAKLWSIFSFFFVSILLMLINVVRFYPFFQSAVDTALTKTKKLGNTWQVPFTPNHSARLWSRWFQMHCGVRPVGAILKAVVLFIMAVVLIAFGIRKVLKRMIVAGVVFLSTSMALASMACKAPDQLWKLVVGIACFHLFSVVVFGYFVRGWQGSLQCFFMAILTQLGLTRETGYRRPVVIFTGVFLMIILVVGSATALASIRTDGTTFGAKPFQWCPAGSLDCNNFTFPVLGSRRPYQFCGLGWPMGPNETHSIGTFSDRCHDYKLSIVDFAEMANAAYYNETALGKIIPAYFPGWKLEDMQVSDQSTGKYTTFAHFSRGNTTVIAVRGTWSAMETLQDLNYWLPAGFVQFVQSIGPSVLPARSILGVMRKARFLHAKKSQFWDLWNYTQKVHAEKMSAKNHRMYITGHSLGGGLAKVVGALVDIPAITFSAPGLYATANILEPTPSLVNLRRSAVTVKPASDIVPMVDDQVGTVLGIECPKNQAYECHTLQFTLCELLAACGDGGGRPYPRGYVRDCEQCAEGGQSKDEEINKENNGAGTPPRDACRDRRNLAA